MEEQIKKHEKWLKEAEKEPSLEKYVYHLTMVRNFQHERAVHLAVMLFCLGLMVALIGVSAWCLSLMDWAQALPVLIATLALAILSGFYVKHYYFLENHIQEFYKADEKLLAFGPKEKVGNFVDKIKELLKR